jgi:hypothetical protein
MKEESSFRKWLQDMYEENCNEHEIFHEKAYTLSEYFSKYKWWLRREYRFQTTLDQ